jgi:hypothetical protein
MPLYVKILKKNQPPKYVMLEKIPQKTSFYNVKKLLL